MQIQVNTDHNIEGREAMTAHVISVVDGALSHLRDHLTRVEVHISDEIGADAKDKQNDKRCMIEARLESYHPLAVTAHGDTVHQAIEGAADKIARLIESTLGRLHDHKHRRDAVDPSDDAPDDAPAKA